MKIEEIQQRFNVDAEEARLIKVRAKKYGCTMQTAFEFRKAKREQEMQPAK